MSWNSITGYWHEIQTPGGGGGTPGGADTQVQFNDAGAFGGNAGLTYQKANNALSGTGPWTLTPGADIVPLTVRAYSSGTSPIIQTQTSGNNALWQVGHAGSHYWADGAGGANDVNLSRTAAGTLGLGTGTSGDILGNLKTGRLTLAGATIATDGSAPALGITATLPASPSATVYGTQTTITSAGSAAQLQSAAAFTLAAGYTGSKATVGISVGNAAASSGTSWFVSQDINIGAAFNATGTGGVNLGSSGVAANATSNFGGFFRALSSAATLNVGQVAAAKLATTNIGLFTGLYSAAPTLGSASAALIADNGDVAADIINARDNGTTVWKVADGGYLVGSQGGVAGAVRWGPPAASPQAYTHGLSADSRAGTDTNVRGAKATIQPGNGTGTGGSGDLSIQTAPPGSTGTAANAYGDRYVFASKPVTLTESSATPVLDIAVPSGTVVGGEVSYLIEASDGTDFQTIRGFVGFSAVNKAGTLTTDMTDTLQAKPLSSGTLTNTTTITTGTNTISVNLNATSSLTQTVLRAWVSALLDIPAVVTTK